MSTKNVRLREINRIVGHGIQGSYKTVSLRYPVELLNAMTAGAAQPDHELCLKKGFMVMLLWNIAPKTSHVNGSRDIVEHMSANLLHLRVAVEAHKEARLSLRSVPCGPGDQNFPIPGFRRTQFPVRVCFQMTVYKSQGQSFGGKLGLDLGENCFVHGPLYVGESRVTDPSNLTVCKTQEDNKPRYVVYREALSGTS